MLFHSRVVDHLRHAAELAQPVEHRAVGRARLQPVRVELPQLAIGLVEEHELLLRIEDGDGRRHAVERAVVGGDLAIELALRRFEGRDVDGRRRGRVVERHHDDIVRLALAADDEGDAGAIAFPARQHARGGAALALLQQLDLTLLHLAAAARFDGAHVGVVDPGEAAILAAQPHGHGKRIEQGAAGAHVACEALVLRQDAGHLFPVPRDIAEAQHGAAAGRPPFRLEMAAGHRMHDDVECADRT